MKPFNSLDLAEDSGLILEDLSPAQLKAVVVFARAVVKDVGKFLNEVDPDFNDYSLRVLNQRYGVK